MNKPDIKSIREQEKSWPESILFDLSRNESASYEWRKAAVELLMEMGSAKANHPELRELRLALSKEREAKQEVAAILESNG